MDTKQTTDGMDTKQAVVLKRAVLRDLRRELRWIDSGPDWFEMSERQIAAYTNSQHCVYEESGHAEPEGFSFYEFEIGAGSSAVVAVFESDDGATELRLAVVSGRR